MSSAAFEYARAGTVEEALALLAADGNAKVIAGGRLTSATGSVCSA